MPRPYRVGGCRVSVSVALLSRDQVEQLPGRAREVVEYRKSGLSLNHIQGCPLDCAYCIRHTYGLWDNWNAAYWRPSTRPRRCSARPPAPSASSTVCRTTTGTPESPRSATSARWPSSTSAGRHTASPRSGNRTRPRALFPRAAAWSSWTSATGGYRLRAGQRATSLLPAACARLPGP